MSGQHRLWNRHHSVCILTVTITDFRIGGGDRNLACFWAPQLLLFQCSWPLSFLSGSLLPGLECTHLNFVVLLSLLQGCNHWPCSLPHLFALQWAPLMEESCRKRSSTSGVSLPEDFSISQIFNQAMAARSINRPMLRAAIALREKGKRLCAAHSMCGLTTPEPWESWGQDTAKYVWRSQIWHTLKASLQNQLYYMRKLLLTNLLLGSLGNDIVLYNKAMISNCFMNKILSFRCY